MTVLSDFAADLAGQLFDEESGLGQAATYYPSTATPPEAGTAVSVIVQYGGLLEETQYGAAVARAAQIAVLVSQVADPRPGDLIDLDPDYEYTAGDLERYQYESVEDVERRWTVEEVIRADGATWLLRARQDARPRMGR